MADPRTKLPKGLPKELVKFVRCQIDDVDVSGDDFAGDVTLEPGDKPGTIKIGYGFLSLTASVNDGQLEVDVPPIPGLADQVTEFVDNLNADFKANGKQFKDPQIKNGKLHLSKEKIPVAVVTDPEPPAISTPTLVTPSTAPPPVAGPPTGSVLGPKPTKPVTVFHDHWKKIGVGALALGVAAFFLFGPDDEPAEIPPPASAQPAETESTPPPAEESETPEAPAEDESPGEADDTETGSSSTDPLDGWFGLLDDFAEDRLAPGTALIVQPDLAGDYSYCGPSDAVGADAAGVMIGQDGDRVTAIIPMAQSPLISANQNSFAAVLQVGFTSGDYRNFIWQVHEGDNLIGEQNPDLSMNSSSDAEITMDDSGFFFSFTADSSDPVTFAMVQTFNQPESSDAVGCDLAYGAASPSPQSDQTGDCTDSDTLVCVNERFAVQVDWDDSSQSGSAEGVAFDSDSGFFFFHDENQADLVVRVINGCSFDERFWVFASSLTDVGYALTVTDTATGDSQTYDSSIGDPVPTIQDTSAFATCP